MIDDELYTWYYYFSWDAGVAELADAPDLGSGAFGVGVRVPSPAPLVNVDNYFGSCLFLFYVIIFVWKFVYIMKK